MRKNNWNMFYNIQKYSKQQIYIQIYKKKLDTS